jgi:hypothetical protein
LRYQASLGFFATPVTDCSADWVFAPGKKIIA